MTFLSRFTKSKTEVMNEEKLKVFVIEDSKVDSFLIRQELIESELFDKIEFFDDPEKALEIILDENNKQNLPDFILLDLNMPVMDGFELIDEIAEVYDEGFEPVLFILTSSMQQRDHENFEKQYTASEFINKPLSKTDLTEKLKKYFPKI